MCTLMSSRVSPVCEYHIHAAVTSGRSRRAEFASATTSFALSTRGGFSNRGGGRAGLTGLKPRDGAQSAPRALENGGGGATYIVGGKTVNTRKEGSGGFGDEHISEKLGRGRAGKRKRAVEASETEKALSALLQKDGAGGSTGGKYLAMLRKTNPAIAAVGGKGKGKAASGEGEGGEEGESEERKRPFSAGAIKRIGFDPTAKRGERNDEETARRVSGRYQRQDDALTISLRRLHRSRITRTDRSAYRDRKTFQGRMSVLLRRSLCLLRRKLLRNDTTTTMMTI